MDDASCECRCKDAGNRRVDDRVRYRLAVVRFGVEVRRCCFCCCRVESQIQEAWSVAWLRYPSQDSQSQVSRTQEVHT
jgi:hypothetical protein